MEIVAKREYPHDVGYVFDVLLSILHTRYKVVKVDKAIRCVEVSTGTSLFSFGENLEVIVIEQNAGSTVRVRSKSRIMWNIASDVEGKARELLDLLEENLD